MVRFLALLSVAVAILTLWVVLREERLAAQGKVPLGRLRRFWFKAERRRAPRFRIDWPIRYQRLEGQANHSAQGRDLSLTGVGLVVEERLEVGSQIQVQFTMPKETHPLEVTGQVAWLREVSQRSDAASQVRRFFIGVQFHPMDPEARSRLAKLLGEKRAA